ncbi:MAG: membrane protein insertion efficiency factor YidD [Sphaerochaetaceae bacterium]|nr:membrane protein insertion efficiency factor YidD [Sphaerochaetaceae bacterium]
MNGNPIREIYLIPVKLYRRFLSPYLGGDCNYSPSCSLYFMQAVRRFGVIRGTVAGISRILRCSRFFIGGNDPVPDTFSLKAIRDSWVLFRKTKHR